MDADTRHQLKQNELAAALARLRDAADRRFWYWAVAIALAIGAWAAYRLWQKQRLARVQAGWSRLLAVDALDPGGAAGSVAQLRLLVAEARDPRLLAAARLRLGNALRRQAYEDPQRRAELLGQAEQAYSAVVGAADAPACFAAAAAYALGTTCESLRRFEQARRVYQHLAGAGRFAGLAFQELASQRLETMDALTEQIALVPGEPPPPATQPATRPGQPLVGPPATRPADTQQP